jgi:hypothetical protein
MIRAGPSEATSLCYSTHFASHLAVYAAPKGNPAEIRAELAGHSLETTMKYGSPKRPEIERAVAVLDGAITT